MNLTPEASYTFSKALSRLFVVVEPELIEQLVNRMTIVTLKTGKTLYQQGDSGQGMHILHTGRLHVRVSTSEATQERTIGVINHGEAVGEIALFTGAQRVATVVASRDSTLGYLTREDFDAALASHPAAQLYIARFIINRLVESYGKDTVPHTMRTYAILPLDDGMDTLGFTRRLQQALLHFGSTTLIGQSSVAGRLSASTNESTPVHTTDFGPFIDHLEARHDYVILETDGRPSAWTQKCVTFADCIVFVASGTTDINKAARRAQEVAGFTGERGPIRELVLLHKDDSRLPRDTIKWLNAIPVSRHHHTPWNLNSAFKRIARALTGNLITVIFGGGGARGFAHIGVVRALHEASIPIDMVGGTSLGAIVGAGVAMGWDDPRMLEEYKGAFVDVNPTDDYTLPIFSVIRGEKMSTGLKRHFGRARIEDLWLPFFAVSSNLTTGKEFVHRTGPLWRCLRTTASLPAILPPMIENSQILVDGGIMNNLPLSVARDSVDGYIIVVDVSSNDDFSCDRMELPSLGEYFKERLFRPTKVSDVPTLHRIALKSTMLGSLKEYEVAHAQADLFISPPVQDFDLLDWSRMPELCDVGYQSTRGEIAAWAGNHPELIQREDFLESCRRGAIRPTEQQ